MRAPRDDLRAANADAAKTLQAQLEHALRGLRIVNPCRPDVIPYSAMIPGIARELTLFARRDPDRAAARAAREELRQAATAASALTGQLGKLPFEAIAAVGGMTCATLQAKLMDFTARAANAMPANSRGQSKASAERVAEHLYEEFSRLTGKQPGRSVRSDDGKEVGAFTALVTEVFAALGISASADVAARKILERHRTVAGRRGRYGVR